MSTTGKQKTLNVYKSLLHDKDSQKFDLLFFLFQIKQEHILILLIYSIFLSKKILFWMGISHPTKIATFPIPSQFMQVT
jgi:hypothetical protein